MNFKKIFTAIITVTAALLLLLGITSCSAACEHVFSEWETVTEPTCTSFGLEKRVCECGYIEYGTSEALAHTPVSDAALEATCTSFGKTEGSHCEACGVTLVAQTEVKMLSHTLSEWETVNEATCTSYGLSKRYCECGFTEYTTTDAYSHDFSEWMPVNEATCTSFGVKIRYCACGYIEYFTVDATGHTPTLDAALEATCTAPGLTEGSHCEVCGFIFEAQKVILPIRHSIDEGTVVEEALCDRDGTKRYSCTNAECDYCFDETYSLEEMSVEDILKAAAGYTGALRAYDRQGHFLTESAAFVIGSDGRIVASNNAIDNASYVLFFIGSEIYEVTDVLAYDMSAGIAVLKIDATDLATAPICDSTPANGDAVYTVGARVGLPISVSSGLISANDLNIGGANYIRHGAELTAEYVGSPLLNRFGEVIGINIGMGELNVSASITALLSLDYSSPMTIEEYGALTYTPNEQLVRWVEECYNATNDNSIAYAIQGVGFYYSLGYNNIDQYPFVEGYWVRDEVYELYVRIIFDNSQGTYQYYATLTDGSRQNEVVGYLNAEELTAEYILTYDTYVGKYWTESELMALYSAAVYDTVGWFSYCLENYFITIDPASFGFTSVSYDKDDEALDKLNGLIATHGLYNENGGNYDLAMSSQVGNDSALFNLSYLPENGEIPSSTIATINYYKADGSLFIVKLTLDSTDTGNRFDFSYATYNGETFVTQNIAWGYLEAGTLTNMTSLTCYVFDGMCEYEDGLLRDYNVYLSYLIDWLNYVMANVSPELSVRDLGFLFYYQ